MINEVIALLFLVLVSGSLIIPLRFQLKKKFAKMHTEIEILKALVEENKKRNDLLVRVTTSHEHFIDDIKKRAEDLSIRTRRAGVR